MEPSTSSRGVIIPQDQLKIWKIFRHVGPEGEEILKTAKLAHPVNEWSGLIVTTKDETYSFYRSRRFERMMTIMRIPELCGVRVKEFVVAHICLAITEDGFLYSWIRDPLLFGPPLKEYYIRQLGRFESTEDIDLTLPKLRNLVSKPHRIFGPLAEEKVQQAAIASRRVMALSVGGDVYQWGTEASEPIFIDREHFDCLEVISVKCIPSVSLALTANGKIFQWGFGNKLPKILDVAVRFKKITASMNSIFALSVEGALYSLWCPIHDALELNALDWKNIFDNQKIQDVVATRWIDTVVVESKDNVRFAFSFRGRSYDPYLVSFSTNCTSMDEFLAEIGQSGDHTIQGQTADKPRTVSADISNLWVTKENVDVKFSVGGKIITAHKLILTTRSDYFAKMFNNAWKETNKGSAIEIKDTTYDIFRSLIFYIYNDKISFPEDDYENIFGLMKLADSHCANNIRRECEKILGRNINTENAIFLARNASLGNALELEKNALEFILDKRLLEVYPSPQDKIELLGMETFQKMAMAALRRTPFTRI